MFPLPSESTSSGLGGLFSQRISKVHAHFPEALGLKVVRCLRALGALLWVWSLEPKRAPRGEVWQLGIIPAAQVKDSRFKTQRVRSTYLESRVSGVGTTILVWASLPPILVVRTLWERGFEGKGPMCRSSYLPKNPSILQ